MENNPFAAVRNNALGTAQSRKDSQAEGVVNFVMVSTDKAVNPISVMGASKRVAELALLSLNNSEEPNECGAARKCIGLSGKRCPDIPKPNLTRRSRNRHASGCIQILPNDGRGGRTDTSGVRA